MQVYCPNCGTENEGMEGGRVTCKACTASFEVRAPTQAPAPPPPVAPPPTGAGWVGPQTPMRPSGPAGYAPPSPSGGTNALAIISLISGLVCCFPLLSPGAAIVCGVIAVKQIDASGGAQGGKGLAIAGIVLGGLTALLQVFYMIAIIAGAANQ